MVRTFTNIRVKKRSNQVDKLSLGRKILLYHVVVTFFSRGNFISLARYFQVYRIIHLSNIRDILSNGSYPIITIFIPYHEYPFGLRPISAIVRDCKYRTFVL